MRGRSGRPQLQIDSRAKRRSCSCKLQGQLCFSVVLPARWPSLSGLGMTGGTGR